MSNLENMYQAVAFVERHLREPISVQDIADAIGYSVYHFSRTFNSATGHSPYDYLIRRRLSESVRDLESERLVADVAFEYQFNNPETYSRAFRRMFGLLPNQVKKDARIPPTALRSPITREYIAHVNQGDYLRPRLVTLDTLHLVGVAALVRGDEDVRGALWADFRPEIAALPERLEAKTYYGVTFFPASGNRRYLLGVAVSALDPMPPGLVGKTLTPARYACFVHRGSSRDVPMTFDYIHQTWLPKSGCTIAAPLALERYGERYRGPDDPESESEVLIPIHNQEVKR